MDPLNLVTPRMFHIQHSGTFTKWTQDVLVSKWSPKSKAYFLSCKWSNATHFILNWNITGISTLSNMKYATGECIQIWFGRGVLLKSHNHTHLKGHFGRKKVPIFRDFFNIHTYFSQFMGVCLANTQKFWNLWKNRPMLRDIFPENGTHI